MVSSTTAVATSALLLLAGALADTHLITMRDGVVLSAQVDLPLFPKGTKYAAVMERSPYGANAEELIADIFGEGGDMEYLSSVPVAWC